jgi:hypothetical protein
VGAAIGIFTQGGAAHVAGSMIDSGVTNNGGTLVCVYSYKADFTTLGPGCT